MSLLLLCVYHLQYNTKDNYSVTKPCINKYVLPIVFLGYSVLTAVQFLPHVLNDEVISTLLLFVTCSPRCYLSIRDCFNCNFDQNKRNIFKANIIWLWQYWYVKCWYFFLKVICIFFTIQLRKVHYHFCNNDVTAKVISTYA